MYDTEGGLSGLWKGWQPTVARAGLLAGAQVRRTTWLFADVCTGVV